MILLTQVWFDSNGKKKQDKILINKSSINFIQPTTMYENFGCYVNVKGCTENFKIEETFSEITYELTDQFI